MKALRAFPDLVVQFLFQTKYFFDPRPRPFSVFGVVKPCEFRVAVELSLNMTKPYLLTFEFH